MHRVRCQGHGLRHSDQRGGQDPGRAQRERQHSAGQQSGPAGEQRRGHGAQYFGESGGAVPAFDGGRAR